MKVLAIDPGKSKCGLVLADNVKRKVMEALVVESTLLVNFVFELQKEYSELDVLIGNGTTSDSFIKQFSFLNKKVSIVDEKNTTLRARERYFEIFPAKGIKRLLPKEILIIDLNLDAISALIILEDYSKFKYKLCNTIDPKTWRK